MTLRHNHLSGGIYIEPYAGGAGAALHLLLQGYVKKIIINDIDPAIYAFWYTILYDTDTFLKKLKNVRITLRTRERMLKVYENPDEHSITDYGFSAFFLNRTSKSGILEGGVIGGKSQSGKWKIDARFNKAELAKRIERIAGFRNRIEIHQEDATSFIKSIARDLPERSLIYLDPPYYHKGGDLYRNHYAHSDHKNVSNLLSNANFNWILTYDDCPEIERLYSWTERTRFSIYYSANDKGRRKDSELLFHSGLNLPCPPFLKR